VSRSELVHELTEANIECRPIVTGNFVKNVDVLKYFDYEVSGDLTNAEYIDKNGLFVGNHQTDLTEQLYYMKQTIDRIFSNY
jgi:CDP-6-deoxy-D-xylo-4-hexulose-3-dehydrase